MDAPTTRAYGAAVLAGVGRVIAATLLLCLLAGCGLAIALPRGGQDVVGGSVAPSPPSRALAGGTLTVGMVIGPAFALDPQNEWTSSTWELFRCCLLRTLMSYDGTGGPTATVPQPDLAAGPPDVSTDGLTWTFRMRQGLRFGPPLDHVPITAADVVRAMIRSGDLSTANAGLTSTYLGNIAGYEEYAAGKADTIAGLETPDPLTLRIRLVRPDATLPYDLTLPTTAPIPPSPSGPSARFGVATGHDRTTDDPRVVDGYGRFLVSSGPYMIEGEDRVDFSTPAEQQVPASGFRPWHFDRGWSPTEYGSVTLVRNPSWNPATDPLRAALPDRIVVRGGSEDALWRQFRAGSVAVVVDDNPPRGLVGAYLRDPERRGYVEKTATGTLLMADFNLAQPPFDDVWVRRAVAYALDRRALAAQSGTGYPFTDVTVANHYVPDVIEGSLASGWDPFPGAGGAPDLAAARTAMSHSRYATGGRCTAAPCHGRLVLIRDQLQRQAGPVARSLAALGIRASVEVRSVGDFYDACQGTRVHPAMCIGGGWFPDVPNAGNTIEAQWAGPSITHGSNITYMGASPARLSALGLPTHVVPSVDDQVRRCLAQVGHAQIACWTRLDQYLVTQVMPSVPLAFSGQVRLSSPQVAAFSWDTAFQSPALDRLAVAREG